MVALHPMQTLSVFQIVLFATVLGGTLCFSQVHAAKDCEGQVSLNPALQAAANELEGSISYLEAIYLTQNEIRSTAASSTSDIERELALVRTLGGTSIAALQHVVQRADLLIRVLKEQKAKDIRAYRAQWMNVTSQSQIRQTQDQKGRRQKERARRVEPEKPNPFRPPEPRLETIPSDPRMALEQTLMQARRRLSGKFTPDARLALEIRKLIRQTFEIRDDDGINALSPTDRQFVLGAFELARSLESDRKGGSYSTDTQLTQVFEMQLHPTVLMPGVVAARAQFQFHDMRGNRGHAVHRLMAVTFFYQRDHSAEWNRYVPHHISKVVWMSRADRDEVIDKKERKRLQLFQRELLSLYSKEVAAEGLQGHEDSTITLVMPLVRLRVDALRGIWAFRLPPNINVDQEFTASLRNGDFDQSLVGDKIQTFLGRLLADSTDLVGDSLAAGASWQIIHVGTGSKD